MVAAPRERSRARVARAPDTSAARAHRAARAQNGAPLFSAASSADDARSRSAPLRMLAGLGEPSVRGANGGPASTPRPNSKLPPARGDRMPDRDMVTGCCTGERGGETMRQGELSRVYHSLRFVRVKRVEWRAPPPARRARALIADNK